MTNPSSAADAGFKALARNEFSTARVAFERALAEGEGHDVSVHLGWLLEQGLGGDKDEDRARSLYRQALDREPASLAAYYLGLLEMKSGNRREGAELLQRAADSGNPSAAYWLYAFTSEASDSESTALAERSLLRAAELGHVYALRDIALRQVVSSKSLGAKAAALASVWKVKAVGMAMTIRNVDDFRVR
jgi:TPR repeat protein